MAEKILLGKDENTYCNSILSGTLFNSPFIFVGKRGWKYVDKEYEGSIVVTWTEIYTAGNETKSRVRIRSSYCYCHKTSSRI
nr:hypothetical protein [Mycoplasmopsis bovis]